MRVMRCSQPAELLINLSSLFQVCADGALLCYDKALTHDVPVDEADSAAGGTRKNKKQRRSAARKREESARESGGQQGGNSIEF